MSRLYTRFHPSEIARFLTICFESHRIEHIPVRNEDQGIMAWPDVRSHEGRETMKQVTPLDARSGRLRCA